MPIRTNRGRAAVYRRLWGWPLRSPRHLVVALIGLALVGAAVGMVLPKAARLQLAHPSAASTVPARPAAGGAGGAEATASALPTRLTSLPETPSSAPPSREALSVAQAWGRAWVNHPAGMTTQQWLEQLKPYTTDEYLPVMASVDPANIPASQVTGPAVATRSYTSSVEVTLPTDAGPLTITVIRTPQGWRVASYTKAS